MRGPQFLAARDAARVESLLLRAESPVTVIATGLPPLLIYAGVDENRGAFSLKVGTEFLDVMEGKAALFHMSAADYERLPKDATLLYAGERWLVSAVINNDHRQGICIERMVLCDGGLFPHRCDIWSQTTTILNGKPQPPVLALVKTNQPCFYAYTINVDEPTGVGRAKSASFFTRDTVHFPYDAHVVNGWWLVDRTRQGNDPSKPQGNSFGAISRIQGAPLYTHPSALRLIGKLTANAMTDEQPPAVLVAAAAGSA